MSDSRQNQASDQPIERTHKSHYIGRFAPSPSGPLHFGSLVCAFASYLDARANQGKWLVRMEDIDPPREQPGASDDILKTLATHGLEWNGEVLFQSSRSEAYYEALESLIKEKNVCFRCNCSRKRLADTGGVYDGHCLTKPPPTDSSAAIRLNVNTCLQHIQQTPSLVDLIQGPQVSNLRSSGDFVIHRKDQFFAYQLAVVVDDIHQGITHVLRGNDLLETTHQQLLLFTLWQKKIPIYAHIPVLVDSHLHKLSKQNHALAIDNSQAEKNLYLALEVLGMNPPSELQNNSIADILNWGIANWNLENVPQCSSIPAPSHTISANQLSLSNAAHTDE